MQPLEQIQTRLTRCYFSRPEKQITLQPGDILREQDEYNDKLYYVIDGCLIGTVSDENDAGDEEQIMMFEAKTGDYIGMHSFFSHDRLSSTRVTAKTASVLAWIDDTTQAVEAEKYGSINEQFMQVMIDELFWRQMRLRKMSTERERVIKRLSEAERLSTLGQLAAGIAHELNNAVSVINSSAVRLSEQFQQLLTTYEPELVNWFEKGCESGQQFSSSEVRQCAREIAERYNLPAAEAKTLAKIWGNQPLPKLPENLPHALSLWDTGRDFYDMLLASRHASSIVGSVKRLGRQDGQDHSQIDVNQTLYETLTLLQSQLRGIQVTLALNEQPSMWASSTELVQVWVNIIKNACDALKCAATENAEITISNHIKKRAFHVMIANNGPQIPKELKEKIFQPNFTTKKDENCIGLGLGLYIVQRIVNSYGGHIRLESDAEQTRFHIVLPLMVSPLTTAPTSTE